jgi:Mycothiol-dependent nitroreductase Rv2466c
VTPVDLWCDPLCPWAWVTSRWLLEVERVREVAARFRVMSLAVLNNEPADRLDAWGPVRVMVATDLAYGPDAVREVYGALGHLIHVDRTPVGRDLYARALHAARRPHTLANAAITTVYDEAVRDSHQSAVADVGKIAATPVIRVPGSDGAPVVFVGPVLSSIPRGEGAGDLWDGIARAARTGGFVELRRRRSGPPRFA